MAKETARSRPKRGRLPGICKVAEVGLARVRTEIARSQVTQSPLGDHEDFGFRFDDNGIQ